MQFGDTKMRVTSTITVLVALGVMSGCGDSGPAKDIPLGLLKEPFSYKRSGEDAIYTIHGVSAGENSTVVTISTRHDFTNGWNYTRRAYQCEQGKTRTLSSASTYEGLAMSNPDPRWGMLVPGSSAYFTGQKACAVAGRSFEA